MFAGGSHGWAGDDKSFFVSTNERDARFFDLYELATVFTAFFETCPVLKAQDEMTRASRLALCEHTARVLARRPQAATIKFAWFTGEGERPRVRAGPRTVTRTTPPTKSRGGRSSRR